jgi:membrane fusion protein
MVTSESKSLVPTAEKAAASPTIPLFRQEVIEYQESDRQFGQVGLLQPLSLKIFSWLITAAVALTVLLLVLGHYSRKATVSGYLTPTAGTAKIFALQRGTITKVLVTDGQDVEKNQPLLIVDTTQIADTGEDVNAAILSSLTHQREQLNQQITREEQRMDSERERLTLIIQGLNNGISQLQGQIVLQQSRINIAEALVQSVSILVQKGAVTDVEYKRRQSDALDQKAVLNSLRGQLATNQNNLTDTQSSTSFRRRLSKKSIFCATTLPRLNSASPKLVGGGYLSSARQWRVGSRLCKRRWERSRNPINFS